MPVNGPIVEIINLIIIIIIIIKSGILEKASKEHVVYVCIGSYSAVSGASHLQCCSEPRRACNQLLL